ncbi:RNA-binding S4 domain-containing protein [Sinomonas sp. ASV486]|uniref:RNA-binding S4 domain-containing protein n=1 Tax=Sinomonas puerhi TaxID=3238584 RepID=A0AB39L726_9MICC|nr:RNA-binding S4 domain-containing protein [Sinomonas sp. ASV486]MDQ4490431.1 RNA-binding S4 domain-containing protein [Sinomonas sp. ASV486]
MPDRESSAALPPYAQGAEEVEVREGTIRLGQLLKLASLVDDGVEAADLIRNGLVKVNGDIEDRRGRQLTVGDVVEVNGQRVRLVPRG